MLIREAGPADLEDVLRVEREAFGYDKEAELVAELLKDPSAEPYLSLLAFKDGKAVGHILFTRASLEDSSQPVSLSLLAPLAVLPEYHSQGIGGRLIEHGLHLLAKNGVELVFVLGHPGYYPRYGFQPAGVWGLQAPYPIPPEHAGAWMVQELRQGLISQVTGTLRCARALDQPQHWRE